MNTLIRIQILFLSFCFTTLLVGAQTEGTTVGRSFTGVKVIKIKTTGGEIDLGRSSTGVVQIAVTFNLDKKKYQPLFEQTDSTLILKEELVFKPSNAAQSVWQVNVPDGLRVEYSTHAGDLKVSNLKIAIAADSFSGNYFWKNVTGNCSIKSPGGDIDIENYSGDLDIEGRSGNVSVSKFIGNMQVKAGPGDITLNDITGGISITTGSGSIQAQGVILQRKSCFNSQAGAAEISLAAPVDVDLTMSTTSGPAIIYCKGKQLSGMLTMTANKKSGGIKTPFVNLKTEEIKSDASSPLQIVHSGQLGPLSNVIRMTTEVGTILVKK